MSKKDDERIQAARDAANEAGHQRFDGTVDGALKVLSDVQKAQTDLNRELTTPPNQNG